MNIKKLITILLFILILIPLKVKALDFPEIYSKHALIYDLNSEKTIYAKESNTKTDIASLTKILTTITAINKITNLEDTVTITNEMLKGIYYNASRAGLKAGDIVTYEDLLYASILPSGADATQVLAITLSGSVANFVDQMNNLAQSIGMTNSHFVNTTGLDIEGHYSTLEDLLILFKYALQNSTFKKVFTTKVYTLTNGLVVKSTLKGYEEKSGMDISRIIGSKTGSTNNAGLCLASLINFEDHEILIITTNAPFSGKIFYNLQDHLTLIDYLDHNYEIEKPIVEEQPKPEENIPEQEELEAIKKPKIGYIILAFTSLIIILLISSLFSKKSYKKAK